MTVRMPHTTTMVARKMVTPVTPAPSPAILLADRFDLLLVLPVHRLHLFPVRLEIATVQPSPDHRVDSHAETDGPDQHVDHCHSFTASRYARPERAEGLDPSACLPDLEAEPVSMYD